MRLLCVRRAHGTAATRASAPPPQYSPSTDTFLAVRESAVYDKHGLVPQIEEIKVRAAWLLKGCRGWGTLSRTVCRALWFNVNINIWESNVWGMCRLLHFFHPFCATPA